MKIIGNNAEILTKPYQADIIDLMREITAVNNGTDAFCVLYRVREVIPKLFGTRSCRRNDHGNIIVPNHCIGQKDFAYVTVEFVFDLCAFPRRRRGKAQERIDSMGRLAKGSKSEYLPVQFRYCPVSCIPQCTVDAAGVMFWLFRFFGKSDTACFAFAFFHHIRTEYRSNVFLPKGKGKEK